MSNQPDPKHVEFAYEQWARGQGFKTSRHPNSGRVYIWYPSEDDSRHAMPRPEIDLEFCNSLPIEDEAKYLAALSDMMPENCGVIIAIHQATIAQRLQAIYESQRGK